MYSHGPHVDVTDLDPQPILGMGSDNYYILNRFRSDEVGKHLLITNYSIHSALYF